MASCSLLLKVMLVVIVVVIESLNRELQLEIVEEGRRRDSPSPTGSPKSGGGRRNSVCRRMYRRSQSLLLCRNDACMSWTELSASTNGSPSTMCKYGGISPTFELSSTRGVMPTLRLSLRDDG